MTSADFWREVSVVSNYIEEARRSRNYFVNARNVYHRTDDIYLGDFNIYPCGGYLSLMVAQYFPYILVIAHTINLSSLD